MKHPQSGARAFGWKSAWDEYTEPMEYEGAEKYDLPRPDSLEENEAFRHQRLHEGDRFWHTEERYTITIVDVRTKIYQGVVGPRGKEGGDAVFYTTDHNPPTQPNPFGEPYNPHRDDEPFCTNVDEFAEMTVSGELVPHKGNGINIVVP